MSDSVTPQTIACQGPLSLEFFRQNYWSGLPFPSPGDLPNPGLEPGSPGLQADSLLIEPPGKFKFMLYIFYHNRKKVCREEFCLRQITLTQGDGWSLVNRGLRSMPGNRKKHVGCVCVQAT